MPISIAFALSACGPRPARIPAPPVGKVRAEIPRNLLTCADEPAAGAIADDVGLTDWIDGVRSAGCDCRSKLAKVRALEDGLPPPTGECSR